MQSRDLLHSSYVWVGQFRLCSDLINGVVAIRMSWYVFSEKDNRGGGRLFLTGEYSVSPDTHFETGFKLIVKCHRVAMYFHAPCGTFVFYVVIVK